MDFFTQNYAAGCVPNLLGQFGEPITYYHAAGAAVGVRLTAIVGPESIEQADEETGRRRQRVREITFSTDPDSAGGGVAEPSEQAIIEYDGVQYAVDDKAPDALRITGSTATLKLVRRELAAKTAAGYRRR